MGIMLQTWSMIMFATRLIPWQTHLLTICEVEGAGGIVAAGIGPSCTPFCGTGGWIGLVVFVLVGSNWWALYLLRYRNGKALLLDNGVVLLVSL